MKKIFFLLACVNFISCKKFLEIGSPPDQVVASYVYSDNTNAIAAVTGLYASINSERIISQGDNGISIQCGLNADEISLYNGIPYLVPYTNGYVTSSYWTYLYTYIYRANAAIEGLENGSLPSIVKQQLIGEMLFFRSFLYFYLVNLYGDVPLAISTDYKINGIEKRQPISKVYDQLISDLLRSLDLLSDNYVGDDVLTPSNERIRPNKWAATALLARVYLYANKYSEAGQFSTMVIDHGALYDTVSLNEVFLMNSKEAIWQLFPIDPSNRYQNTLDAPFLLFDQLPDAGHPFCASPELLTSLDSLDERRRDWLKPVTDSATGDVYWFFQKYKKSLTTDTRTEYIMVIRLAEMYLIRAESNVQNGDLAGGRHDINVIRHRARLNDITSNDKDELLGLILKERQAELFMEWGHRWFDLKRTNKIDEVMKVSCPRKGGIWESYKQLYPIPSDDIRINPNLKQNPGYSI